MAETTVQDVHLGIAMVHIGIPSRKVFESLSGYFEPFLVPLRQRKPSGAKRGTLQSAQCWADSIVKCMELYSELAVRQLLFSAVISVVVAMS